MLWGAVHAVHGFAEHVFGLCFLTCLHQGHAVSHAGFLAAGDMDEAAACAAAAPPAPAATPTKKSGGDGKKLSDEGIVAIAVAVACVVGFVALAWGPGLRRHTTEGTQTPKHNAANGHNFAPGMEPSLSPARV